jgi:hypothetical protein
MLIELSAKYLISVLMLHIYYRQRKRRFRSLAVTDCWPVYRSCRAAEALVQNLHESDAEKGIRADDAFIIDITSAAMTFCKV